MKQPSNKVTIRKIKPVHKDERGLIIDILEGVPVKHTGLVTFAKGVIRGNHYHKKQTQYTYVLEGEIKLVTRKSSGGKITARITRPGDFVSIPPGFIHTYIANKKSVIVVLTNFSRSIKKYEDDTFRVELVK